MFKPQRSKTHWGIPLSTPSALGERGKGKGLSVIFFHTLQFQHILFWLAINAKLACKRRPFDLQLTPFKQPKDALLKLSL